MEIHRIENSSAARFIEKWHYSHRIPTGQNICFGLFDGRELYAVIVYGIGVNPYQAKFLGVEQVIEIKRMARMEPKRPYPLSKLISKTVSILRRERAIDAVVAFADPSEGHEGGVYKASSFMLHGQTNAEWHLLEKDGTVRHRRYAFRYARRKGITVAEARDALHVERVQTPPKFRWVRYLKRPTQLKGKIDQLELAL